MNVNKKNPQQPNTPYKNNPQMSVSKSYFTGIL